MKVLIEVHHPAHIHFWKNVVQKLQDKGHHVLVLGRNRNIMTELLEAYKWIPHKIPEGSKWEKIHPIFMFIYRQVFVTKWIIKFKPNVVASLMGSYCQSAKLLGIRNVIFTDSEFQNLNHRIAHPFADEIHTPQCLTADFGNKHFHYNGFHELSYINKDASIPEPSFNALKYDPRGRGYVVMRLCAWDAYHDVHNHGLSSKDIMHIIKKINERWEVWIQPEGGKLPPELEPFRLEIPAHHYHSLIQGAKLVVSEGFTTASEALALGIPSVVINQITCDILDYQNKYYRALTHFTDSSEATRWIVDFCEQEHSINTKEVSNKYLRDHCHVADYAYNVLTGTKMT
ncbi:MAG: DUF354 domain-containing protein [Opitutales bacterium]